MGELSERGWAGGAALSLSLSLSLSLARSLALSPSHSLHSRSISRSRALALLRARALSLLLSPPLLSSSVASSRHSQGRSRAGRGAKRGEWGGELRYRVENH